jgi:hypothetical protein
MLGVVEIVTMLGGPVVGAALVTEAVLARIERRERG